MARDFLDDYSAPGADEPADTSHCMVVRAPARTSEELEAMEAEYLADPVYRLPIPFRTGAVGPDGTHGTFEPLSKRELEQLAALGFSEAEWQLLNEYVPEEKK